MLSAGFPSRPRDVWALEMLDLMTCLDRQSPADIEGRSSKHPIGGFDFEELPDFQCDLPIYSMNSSVGQNFWAR
jgi:hypothetical protein